jgi:hypothetical protein
MAKQKQTIVVVGKATTQVEHVTMTEQAACGRAEELAKRLRAGLNWHVVIGWLKVVVD